MALSRITANSIADGTVVAADIADGSITTAKIADANVSSSKLASSLSIGANFFANNITANTNIVANTGSAAAPSIFPTDDTNTGIFFPAADTIAFAEGGAEAMRIDSSGRVLIGQTSGSYPLEVTGGNGNGIKFIESSNSIQCIMAGFNSTALFGTITNHPMLFWVNNGERARIDSSGNLLVGRTSSMAQGVGIEVGEVGIDGVSGFGMTSTVSIADESAIALSTNTGLLIFVEYFSGSAYPGAMFYCSYAAGVVLVAQSGGAFAATDTDTNVCVFKSNSTDVVSVKNRLGATRSFSIHTLQLRGQ